MEFIGRLYIYFIIAVSGYFQSVTDAAVLNITLTANVNREATLPCRLSADITGVSVRWYSEKDGWLTSGQSVYKHQGHISVQKPAPNEWNLRITKVSWSFEDTYTCKTDNDEIISSIKLIIESPPKIDESASSQNILSVNETETAKLTCAVTGTPKPKITWYRGKSETPIGITGHRLILRDVSRYAADNYICRANNKNGEAEKRINLTVSFAPEVTVREPVVYASGGEVVVMSCIVQASPLYKAYWTDKRGSRISANWKFLVMQEDAGDYIPAKFLTLIIRKAIVTAKDYGMYTCVGEGDHHVAKGLVELKEKVLAKKEEATGEVIKYD